MIYGIGYLVVSIHLAALGMVLSDPFRPKIAAAGVLFAVLFGIPVWVAKETMSRLQVPIADLAPGEFPVAMYKTAHLYHMAVLITMPLALVFALTDLWFGWRVWLVIGLIAVESMLIATARASSGFRLFIKGHPGVNACYYLLLNVAYVAITISALRPGRFNWFGVVMWMYAIGLMVTAIPLDLSGKNAPGFTQQNVLQFLAPIYFFATLVYPHVKAEWGGGQPVSVIVRFVKDSPLSPSQSLKLQLVDDTETGLYVLPEGKRHVLFIPHTDVAAISFSSDLSDMPQH
jgi:hypothetical protein